MSQLVVAYDARFLQPKTRHWGVGVFMENLLTRLASDFKFVGLAHRFRGAHERYMKTWPAVPQVNRLIFEASPLFADDFDLYWGTSHFLPQALRGPSVLTVHDVLLLNHMEEGRWTKFLTWRFCSSLARADRVVADSKTTANDLLAQFPELKGRIEVALLGFEAPGLIAGETATDGSYANCPYVVMLGCHRPRKNLDLAVAVVSRLVDHGVAIQLLITGDVHHSFRGALRSCRGSVRELGVLPKADVFRLLQSAVALFFPSRYEGFGLPVLEAMAAGCPVLALDTPINREIAGQAAWLLPEEPEEWEKAFKRLISSASVRAEMRAMGFENLARFSWHRTAAIYRQIFKEVACVAKVTAD